MKAIKFITVITLLAMTTVSCVENSEKYKKLVAERDSLQSSAMKLETGYNETLDILNSVDEGFAMIRAGESKMVTDMQGIEGKSGSKKEQVVSQIKQIKDILDQNKKKIEQLQKISNQLGNKNTTLLATIKRMETELAEKNALIESLQNELSQKNIQISELSTTVKGLNSNIAEMKEVSTQQQSTIKTQDSNLNQVWYCIATSKELKTAQIVSGNGLFKAKTVLDKNYDVSSFKQADLRELSSINTDSKKIKILTNHPKESYTLTEGADKKVTINITNPQKFWSVSKYLVVQK